MPEVSLRPLADADLDVVFAWEQDPRAVAMAAFTREDPSDRSAFDDHQRRIHEDPAAWRYGIEQAGRLVGTIASFDFDGDRDIAYWIDPARWGEGLASAALARYLLVETVRPLHARVAEHNGGSAKVLERAGFVHTGSERSYAAGVGREVVEHLYQLDS
jgi:RimJ/RimL family protein N-acetyltransferase